MKPPAFDYCAPSSLEEALELLSRHGDEGKVLAGGQSLVPAMNFRLASPGVLIDLNRVRELDYIVGESDTVRIGAMTRQRAVERSLAVAEHSPLVTETLPFVAHPQIRNRGTFGGSLAHADPAAELPAVLLALDGRLRLRRGSQERTVLARDFYLGLFETALAPDELMLEVELPVQPAGTGWAFEEMARRHGDYALVGVAVTVRLTDEGRCQLARIALLSVGETAVLAERAASSLLDARGAEAEIAEAARFTAHHDIDPGGDIHASAAYRRHLAEVLTRRALTRAFERAVASRSSRSDKETP